MLDSLGMAGDFALERLVSYPRDFLGTQIRDERRVRHSFPVSVYSLKDKFSGRVGWTFDVLKVNNFLMFSLTLSPIFFMAAG
jgi:hypothetical protein